MSGFLSETADFEFNGDAAAIGTQGPDIFFFHRIIPLIMPGRSRHKIGSLLHRAKPSELFDAFSEYCSFSPNADIAKSYIYGFILHYALDRKCHPYVYSLQEKILEKNRFLHKSAAHNRIELAMDSLLLESHLGIYPPNEFSSSETFTEDISIIEEIAHLLSFTAEKITNQRISEKEISKAVFDTITMQKILQDKSGAVKLIAKAAETVFAPVIRYYKFSSMLRPKDLEKAKKYANINHGVWISPFNRSAHNKSFEELFEEAKGDAKELILGFNEMLKGNSNGYSITQNISFLTGLEVD